MQVRIVDQNGVPVEIAVRVDGGPGDTWIKPGRRHRIKIRPKVVALLLERIELVPTAKGSPADWMINDIRIGNRSMFSDCADRCDDDGVPGDVFARGADRFVSFETLQTAMDLVFDVTYVGQNPEGQPFACVMSGRVAR